MWRIPLSDMNFDNRESQAVQQVLDSGWLTMGPRTKDFEEAFAVRHGARGAVAVTNCTCALELVYRYIFQRVPDRKVVVVPDITFVATANAVLSAGGTPLLCDIDAPDRPFMSPSALEALLASHPDIGAVVLVHYGGYDAGVEKMAEICNRHNIFLVEDCAHSPEGKTITGKRLGTVGFAGCFSFFSNKNLATGEGGMIITNESDMLVWASMARSHGVTSSTHTRHSTQTSNYDVMFPGHNYRCTEITAALGLVQLEKLQAGNQRRRELTHQYCEFFSSIEGVNVVLADPDSIVRSDCHILPLYFKDVNLRGKAIEALTAAGIQTSHHYPAIHTLAWYAERSELAPVPMQYANNYSARELTLPLHPRLSDGEVQEICETIRKAVQ